ncbi:MAG: aspartate aminotransferase family protein [Geminicoccaceae bacterium]
MPLRLPAKTRELMERRATLLGPNVSTFYEEPVHFVRGEGVWLWDADGRMYLDCYNNVPHVGHCNPRVVEAICRQAATLNTHTRYLHEGILDYIERLTGTFDETLSTAIMTCTGSEANDIALRMATASTGKRGVIASDYTYHGNTTVVSQLSRSNVPGTGVGDHVRFVPAPDSYRPLGGEPGMAHAHAFADAVAEQIAELKKTEHGFSAIILCPFFVNEGFPDLPEGWLKPTVDVVRKAGGLVIADEVQPGFGRVGTHMWGHQRQDIKPDIVTLGKPMANGHPVGAVVTTSDIMAAFRTSFRYFNTFGGNPVSSAAAMAVLEELEDKDLVVHAKTVGDYAQARLKELATKHKVIGDIRGSGMIFGAEMVSDRGTKEPATDFTDRVVNRMRQQGVILSNLGRFKNTLKIRPPMPFTRENADLLFDVLDDVLTSTPLEP